MVLFCEVKLSLLRPGNLTGFETELREFPPSLGLRAPNSPSEGLHPSPNKPFDGFLVHPREFLPLGLSTQANSPSQYSN